MEGESYQQLNPGDLVFMRDLDEVLGWITKKDTVFMILGVERDPGDHDKFGRDKVRFSGGGIVGETLAGYFVRCDIEDLQNV
jgi:hypothetical protein